MSKEKNTKINKAEDPGLQGKLSIRERVCYGFGDMASNIGFSAVSAFIMYYYTNVVGIAAGTAGMILLLSKIFDGVSDLLVGVLVDKTHTRWGKARPWVLFGSIPFVIALILTFSVPNISTTGKVIYAFVTYTLVSAICYTSVNIPYGAMSALMTQNQYERGVLSVFRMTFASIGSLLVSSATLSLVSAFGDDKSAWTKTFGLYGLVALFFFFLCFKGTKERVTASTKQSREKNTVPVKDSIKALFKNKYWFMMLMMQMINLLSMALTNNGVYYFQYSLGNRNLYSVSMVVSMICMMIGIVVFASPLIKRVGKRNTSLIGCIGALIGCIIMALGMVNSSLVFVGIAIKGLGSGLCTSTLTAMIADAVEYGEYKTGIRSEGLTYSATTFGGKVGSGLGSALAGFILSIGGFVEASATQGASAITAINTMYLYIPIVLFAIDIVILLMYNLDREYPKIMEELSRRKAEGGEA